MLVIVTTLSVLALRAVASRAPDDRDPPAIAAHLLDVGLPVYCGANGGNLVALSFDDGPGAWTRETLRTLFTAGAGATFFDVGKLALRRPRLVRREALLGEVGNHSWSHPNLAALPDSAVRAEIAGGLAAAERSGGEPVWLFRPPYGEINPTIAAAAAGLDLVTVLWSVFTDDTALTDPDAIAANVEAGVRPGSIILLHENNNRGPTVAALPRILSILAARGLRPVTVGQLLVADPPSDRQLRTGPYACGPTVWAVSPSEGPAAGGSQVTIAGDALNLPRNVMFGTRKATIVDPGDGHQFRVVVPPGQGTVDVTVSTHFGPSPVSSLDHYTYR